MSNPTFTKTIEHPFKVGDIVCHRKNRLLRLEVVTAFFTADGEPELTGYREGLPHEYAHLHSNRPAGDWELAQPLHPFKAGDILVLKGDAGSRYGTRTVLDARWRGTCPIVDIRVDRHGAVYTGQSASAYRFAQEVPEEAVVNLKSQPLVEVGQQWKSQGKGSPVYTVKGLDGKYAWVGYAWAGYDKDAHITVDVDWLHRNCTLAEPEPTVKSTRAIVSIGATGFATIRPTANSRLGDVALGYIDRMSDDTLVLRQP